MVFNQELKHCHVLCFFNSHTAHGTHNLVVISSHPVIHHADTMVYNCFNISVPHGEILVLPSGHPSNGWGIRLGGILGPEQASFLCLHPCKLFLNFCKADCFSSCCANLSKNTAPWQPEPELSYGLEGWFLSKATWSIHLFGPGTYASASCYC